MIYGELGERVAAVAARKRAAALLVGQALRMHEGQTQELALVVGDPPIEAALEGADGDRARERVRRVAAALPAEHVARELVEHDRERERAFRRILPLR